MGVNDNQPKYVERPFPAYEGEEPYIFISYSHMDAKRVFPEIMRFHNEGYPIWYDQGLTPGQEWDDEIAEALIGCSLLVVFISPHSMGSKNVRDEIKLAINEEIDVVPIYFEETELPPGLRLRLSNTHAIFKYKSNEKDYFYECFKAFRKAKIPKLDFDDELIIEKQNTIEPDKKEISSYLNIMTSEELTDVIGESIEKNYFKEFEDLNTTSESIYDLVDLNVLIILKDGKNITNWDDVENKEDVLYVSEDLSNFTDLSSKYKNLTSLKAIVAYGVTNKVKNVESMFSGCSSLVDLSGLKDWNTSNVRNMESMFSGCSSLVDLSGLKDWNTSNVMNMASMFSGCSSLVDLSGLRNWNTINVTTMDFMFSKCSSLVDLTGLINWNTLNITTMRNMFLNCGSLVELSGLKNWNTSNVENMFLTFGWCSSLVDISDIKNWVMSNVTTMYGMFRRCSSLVDLSPLSDWDVSNVTNMAYMFRGCNSLTNLSDIKNWDVSNVSEMYYMFSECSSLVDISGFENWNNSNVNDINEIFNGCDCINIFPNMGNKLD